MEGIVIIITPNTVQLVRTEEYFQRDITTQQAVVPLVHLAGGLMGSGIATALILSGYPVILKEVNDKFLQAGLERIKGLQLVTSYTISSYLFSLHMALIYNICPPF